jgi:Tol biopolymer transport system component
MIMKNIQALGLACLFLFCQTLSAQTELDDKLSLADKQFDLYAYNLAIKSYSEVLQSQPNHVHALTQLGRSYLQTGQAAKSIGYFEKASALPGFDDAGPLHFGQALMMSGDYAKAKVWFNMYADVNEAVGKHFVAVANWAAQNSTTQSDYEVKPEMLNTPQADFLPAFFGEKVVYGSTRNDIVKKVQTGQETQNWAGGANPQLFVTTVDAKSGFLQRPTLLKGELQTSMNEGPVAFSPDGSKVAFCRNNFLNGNRQIAETGMNLSLYTADVVGGAWTNVRAFPHNGSDFSTGFPAFSSDGTKLYYSSNRPGTGQGGWDIYYSELSGAKWSSPNNLGSEINTPGNEITPYFDGGSLYFASDWHAGYGGLDVFVCEIQGGNYSNLKNMGLPINSAADDYGLIYRSSGSTGYFTSSRAGGRGLEDIYKFTRKTSDILLTVKSTSGSVLSGAVVDLTACGKSIYTTAADGKLLFAQPRLAQSCKGTVSFVGMNTMQFDVAGNSTQIELIMSPEGTPVAATSKPTETKPAESTGGVSPMVYSYKTSKKEEEAKVAAEKAAAEKAKKEKAAADLAAEKAAKEQAAAELAMAKAAKEKAEAELAAVKAEAAKQTQATAATPAPTEVVTTRSSGSMASVKESKVPVEAVKPMQTAPLPDRFNGYAVQLISLPEDTDESNLAKYSNLSKYGHVYVKNVDGKKRIRVGVFENAKSAKAVMAKIAKEHKGAFMVQEENMDIAMLHKPAETATTPAPAVAVTTPQTAPVATTTTQTAPSIKPVEASTPTKATAKTVEKPAADELVIMRYAVQLAAFKADDDAFNLSDYVPLGDLGKIYTIPGKDVSRVRLGVWEDPARAELAKKEAVKRGYKDAIVVNEKSNATTDKLLIKDAPKPTEVAAVKPVTHSAGTKSGAKGTKAAPLPEPKKIVVPEPAKPAAPVYLVRVAAHQNPKAFDDDYIAGIPARKEVRKSGKMHIVYLTGFAGLEDAIEAKNTLHARGFNDAYIMKEGEDKKLVPVKL